MSSPRFKNIHDAYVDMEIQFPATSILLPREFLKRCHTGKGSGYCDVTVNVLFIPCHLMCTFAYETISENSRAGDRRS